VADAAFMKKEGWKEDFHLTFLVNSRHPESRKSPWNLCPSQSYKNSLVWDASLTQDRKKSDGN